MALGEVVANAKRARYTLPYSMIDRVQNEVDMLDRHLRVLKTVIANEPIGIVNLADETGYPHHKVRYSLRVLKDEALVEPTSKGAVTTDYTEVFVDDVNDQLDAIIDRLGSLKIDGTGL